MSGGSGVRFEAFESGTALVVRASDGFLSFSSDLANGAIEPLPEAIWPSPGSRGGEYLLDFAVPDELLGLRALAGQLVYAFERAGVVPNEGDAARLLGLFDDDAEVDPIELVETTHDPLMLSFLVAIETDGAIISAVAENGATPRAVLQDLIAEGNDYDLRGIVVNPKAGEKLVLAAMERHIENHGFKLSPPGEPWDEAPCDIGVADWATQMPGQYISVLTLCAQLPLSYARAGAVRHPRTPPNVVWALERDPHPDVQGAVGRRRAEEAKEDARRKSLAGAELRTVSMSPGSTAEELERARLATDDRLTLIRIAKHLNSSPDTVAALSRSAQPGVRSAARSRLKRSN